MRTAVRIGTTVSRPTAVQRNRLMLAATTLATLQEEYAHSETEEVTEQIGGRSISGYDLNFRFLDLSNTALIRGFRTTTASCLVLCQAEDRELEDLAPVFRAITTSLLTDGAGR